MGRETEATRIFCEDAARRGAFTQVMAGSLFQTGVPDRYILSRVGRHVWLEFKYWDRVMLPERIAWRPLFGSDKRAAQDDFVRAVYARDPQGAAVCVAHPDPERWALYVPTDRPDYVRGMVGRAAILHWVTREVTGDI